jgi:hypothetical protein
MEVMKASRCSKNLRSALVVAVGFVAGIGLTVPQQSTAAPFHSYSTGYETTGGSHFTGVGGTRLDEAISGLPDDFASCDTLFAGYPVYQTEWVGLTSDGKNWHELGTAHQCGDRFRAWYAGYGNNGAWYPIWTHFTPTNGVSHVFRIYKSASTTTQFWIDGVNKVSLTTSATGTYVHVGLESYASGATAPAFNISSLGYQKDTGAVTPFSGQDSKTVNANMCGKWVSATTWRAGENVSC